MRSTSHLTKGQVRDTHSLYDSSCMASIFREAARLTRACFRDAVLLRDFSLSVGFATGMGALQTAWALYKLHGCFTNGGQSGRTANRRSRGPRPGRKASTQTQPARPTGTQTAQETQDDGMWARPEKHNGTNRRPRQPINGHDN
jgi:hypothetical protein